MRYWDITYYHSNGSKGRVYDVPAEDADAARTKALSVTDSEHLEIKHIEIKEAE